MIGCLTETTTCVVVKPLVSVIALSEGISLPRACELVSYGADTRGPSGPIN